MCVLVCDESVWVSDTTCECPSVDGSITIIFGTNVTEKAGIQNVGYFIFPPHLTSASALPGETGNPEIALVIICHPYH